jgi:hypothetical protein
MLRIRMILLTLAALAIASFASADTITSTASGGSWFDSTTWIGGVVPEMDDDVIIEGPVTVAGMAACDDLAITALGSLEGELVAPPRSLHVGGSLENAGQLGVANGFWLDLRVDGDLYNSGQWAVDTTTLGGSADRTIGHAPGARFETALVVDAGSGATITSTTPLVVAGEIDMTYGDLVLSPGHSLTLDPASFRGNLQAGGNEVVFTSWSYLAACTIDDAVLVGDAYASFSVTATTRLEVMDRLANGGTGGGGAVVVEGDLVNHGEITNENYSFTLWVTGDVENNGQITNPQLLLQGVGTTHEIAMGPGAFIEADVFLPEFQPATIVATTPCEFRGGLGLGEYGTLILEDGASLALGGFGGLGSGTVIAGGNTISSADNAAISSVTIDQGVFGDQVVIHGINQLTGGLTVEGTVVGWPWAEATLVVDGLLRNDGAIMDGDHPVRVHALGDVANDGTFANAELRLMGSADQRVGAGVQGIGADAVVLVSELAGASYQWLRDGEVIPGATGIQYTLSGGVGAADHGTYVCEVDGQLSRAIVIQETLDVTDAPAASMLAALAQNRPNPFNPATEFAFSLERGGRVSLVVYDLAGRVVDRLVDRELPAGAHVIPWQPRNLASGTYVYRLKAEGVDLARTCTLLK